MKKKFLLYAFSLALVFSVASALSETPLLIVSAANANSNDCEGDACCQITVTWEEAKQRYKLQNNSSNQWVRVAAANLAATDTTCVEPGKEAYLSLKSIVGSYKARFDATCVPE